MSKKSNLDKVLHKKITFKQVIKLLLIVAFVYCLPNILIVFVKVQFIKPVEIAKDNIDKLQTEQFKLSLESVCDWDQIVCYNSHFVSPLFPNKSLKYCKFKEDSWGDRNIIKILKDEFWDIYWIKGEHTWGSYHEVFGPFRFNFTDEISCS